MKKIVINTCFGGFGLSHEATMRYGQLAGIKLFPFIEDGGNFTKGFKFSPYTGQSTIMVHYATKPISSDGTLEDNSYFSVRETKRDDPILVKVVEEMGSKANAKYSELSIVEIPDDVIWEIDDYDGKESIEEQHRSWR